MCVREVFAAVAVAASCGSIAGAGACPGDVNGDGIVDVADFLQVLEDWGCTACPGSDVDGSGLVDVGDFLQVLGEWGCTIGGSGTLTKLFNGGESGTLPAITFSRGIATKDWYGADVPADAPRWGLLTQRPVFSPATLARSVTASQMKAGYDRDGVTPMLCYMLPGTSDLEIWIGGDLNGGSPTQAFDLTKTTHGTSIDLLVGAGAANGEDPDVSYSPTGGCILPGCICFVAKRVEWFHGQWATQGTALVAYQHEPDGSWTRRLVGNDTDFLTGVDRGAIWQGMSFFPNTLGQDPLTDVWLSFADYLSHQGVGGGRAFLMRARRDDADSNWSWTPDDGTLFHVPDSQLLIAGDVHCHGSIRTPNGLVQIWGDTYVNTEVWLHTCDDWDDFTTPAHWTRYQRVLGAGTVSGAAGPDQTPAPQPLGFAPFPGDLNSFLAAGDITPSSLYKFTVPPDPADAITILPWFGHAYSGGTAGSEHFMLSSYRPDLVVHGNSEDGANSLKSYRGHVAWNGAVARVCSAPSAYVNGTYIVAYGDTLVSCTAGADVGLYTWPLHSHKRPVRGLSLSPGATNLVELSGGGLKNVVPGAGGASVTQITDGMHPYSGAPLDAPGSGPVYHAIGNASGGHLWDFSPQGTRAVTWGDDCTVAAWVLCATADGVPRAGSYPQVRAGPPFTVGWPPIMLESHEQWVYCLFRVTPGGGFVDPGPKSVQVRDAGGTWAVDSLWQVEGVYASQRQGYPIAPSTAAVTGPDEIAVQPLTGVRFGSAYTFLFELAVPLNGLDYYEPHYTLEPLLTIYGDDDEYVEVHIDHDSDALTAQCYNGGTLAEEVTVPGVVVQRDDVIWLGLSFSGRGLTVFAVSGGPGESIPQATSAAFAGLATPPAEIRFSNRAQDAVPIIDVLSIKVVTGAALDEAGFLAAMAEDIAGAAGQDPQVIRRAAGGPKRGRP
jgi:hypothetical protein